MKGTNQREFKLLYDLAATQPNLSGKRHGGGRYGEIVFLRMVAQGHKFSCFYDSRNWFNPDIRAVVEAHGIPLFDVAERSVQQMVDEEHITRLYSCLVTREELAVKGCELYGTMHGLRSFETPMDNCFWHYKHPFLESIKFFIKQRNPHWYRRYLRRKESARLLHRCAEGTARTVVVSEHTKYAVRSFFPELGGVEIPVFYSPNTSGEVKSEKRIAKGEGAERYFLCVSGNRWEKNNLRAIEAFDRCLSGGLLQGVRMKVTGASSPSIYKYKIQNTEAFDFLGYVSDEELERLYAEAYLFVYPSLNEGFGYPPVEAMRYGVPVIASPLSSIAEVLDSAALYFNPFLVEEIMGRMQMMMEPERHAEYSARGFKQYQKVAARQERDLNALVKYILR